MPAMRLVRCRMMPPESDLHHDRTVTLMSSLAGKPTSYSRVTLSRIMTTADVNLYGTVHGGVVMKFVDDAAGAVAARHSGGNALTASIDEIVFLAPVRVG